MADLEGVRNDVKLWIGRNWTGIDAVIDSAINASVELFGNTIASVYDEQRWAHTIVSGDVSGNVDNWALPATVKHIITAAVKDPTSTEAVYHEMTILSPAAVYDLDSVYKKRPGYDLSRIDIGPSGVFSFSTFEKGYRSGRTRVDRSGRPELIWRVGGNAFVHPRPSTSEIDYSIELLLAVRPAFLVNGTDTNTYTDKYPHLLSHFAAGVVWASRLGDTARAAAEFGIAGQLLTQIANQEEISKLINIQLRRT